MPCYSTASFCVKCRSIRPNLAIKAGMAGRKPSQTTALDAILEVAQKYKKEVLAAAEKS